MIYKSKHLMCILLLKFVLLWFQKNYSTASSCCQWEDFTRKTHHVYGQIVIKSCLEKIVIKSCLMFWKMTCIYCKHFNFHYFIFVISYYFYLSHCYDLMYITCYSNINHLSMCCIIVEDLLRCKCQINCFHKKIW